MDGGVHFLLSSGDNHQCTQTPEALSLTPGAASDSLSLLPYRPLLLLTPFFLHLTRVPGMVGGQETVGRIKVDGSEP